MPIVSDQRALITCGLPSALDAMGERWSFLILRAAFNDLAHFEEFQATLGIARNILANRLGRLVDHRILSRSPCADDRRKIEYRLTEKGEALMPTLIALRQWGERWGCGTPSSHVLVDRQTCQPIQTMQVRGADGRALKPSDVRWLRREEVSADDARPRERDGEGADAGLGSAPLAWKRRCSSIRNRRRCSDCAAGLRR